MSRNRRKGRSRPNLDVLEDRTLLSAVDLAICGDGQVFGREALRVVLISDAVAQAREVAEAAEAGVITVTYPASTTDTAGLIDRLADISARHGGARIGQLGLVAHGGTAFVAVGGDAWSADTLATHAGDWARLRSLLTEDARFDLYACNVAADARGRAFVDDLAASIGASVSASDDPVGSGPGADFVWEYQTGIAPPSDDPLA